MGLVIGQQFSGVTRNGHDSAYEFASGLSLLQLILPEARFATHVACTKNNEELVASLVDVGGVQSEFSLVFSPFGKMQT